MPITTETTEDFQGILQTGRGLVTGDELVAACHAAFQLVQNTRNFHYEFIDLSESTALEFTEEHLEAITTRDRLAATYRPDAIVVIVAPRDDFYELGKVWESRVRDLGWTTHIARDRSEGLRWLRENFARSVVIKERVAPPNPSGERLTATAPGAENRSMKKWFFEADYLQSCNCDYGCPCEFSAPPTKGFCEGLGAWRIERGDYDGVALDGLGLGFAAKWPGAIHEGNGTVCLFVDEKASAEQREALLAIGSGQAGGLPYEILTTTFTTFLEPQFISFDFNVDGVQSSVRIGGDRVRIALEPIKNPVTREPEQVAVNHGTGFIFKTAECASAREGSVEVENMSFSYPDKAGFIARIRYGN